MISTQALIDKFQYALNNRTGYIYGQTWEMWTQEKQNQKVSYMVSKYGVNWEKDKDAAKDKYYNAAKYGSKWIGHIVTDCSGLFAWAFKQLGGYMYHGSNTMYREYCTSKGKLTSELKKSLQPGTAVFTGSSETDHPHVGLYVGNGKVIEAQGTQAGVCVSNLTANKWTYCGKLKGVDYSTQNSSVSPSEPTNEQKPVHTMPTLRKGDKGDYVSILQNKLLVRGYKLPRFGADGDFGNETLEAVKQFQRDHGLTADGVVGAKTWGALESNTEKVILYTAIVKGVTKAVGDEIIAKYGGTLSKEG